MDDDEPFRAPGERRRTLSPEEALAARRRKRARVALGLFVSAVPFHLLALLVCTGSKDVGMCYQRIFLLGQYHSASGREEVLGVFFAAGATGYAVLLALWRPRWFLVVPAVLAVVVFHLWAFVPLAMAV